MTNSATFSTGSTPLASQPEPEPLPPAETDLGLGGIAYKWWVVAAVVFGVFMSVLDTTIVNIALAKLQAVFGATLDGIQWVVTAYVLALTVSIPFFSYLADRLGMKRVYLISLGLFTLASALCGLAWSLSSLIMARILQGLGGGALLPLATAQIFAVFPHQERGRAAATLGVPVLLAPALGPTLGGYIVEYLDWRLIFYINVPIGIAGILFGGLALREYHSALARPLDVPGLILSTFGFSTLVYGISSAASDGWGSSTVIAFLGVGLVCLAVLTLVELRSAHPLLDIHLLAEWNFTAGNLITWALQIGLFGALFLLPIFLQSLRGLTPIQAGLWLLPSALVTAVVLPVGGVLVDRFGAKPIIVIGTLALTLTTYALSHLTLSTTFWTLQLWLLGRSVAIAFTLQPTQVIALSRVPRAALARATSLFTIMRQVVVAFGTALLSTYVENRQPLHFAHLAEQVTAFSRSGLFVNQVAAYFQSRGFDQLRAQAAALGVVTGQLQLQATILAFRDAFLLTMMIVASSTLIALWLRPAVKLVEGHDEALVLD